VHQAGRERRVCGDELDGPGAGAGKGTVSDEEQLLPCPFCGAAASIEETRLLGDVRKSAGCGTEFCQGYQSTLTFATRREAIAAWNRRAPKPNAPATDTERLNWLAKTGARVVNPPNRWEVYLTGRGFPTATGQTAREAIDAAMPTSTRVLRPLVNEPFITDL